MPNPLGRWFISGAHDDEVIEALICAASAALEEL
jgi:hypothetical protein